MCLDVLMLRRYRKNIMSSKQVIAIIPKIIAHLQREIQHNDIDSIEKLCAQNTRVSSTKAQYLKENIHDAENLINELSKLVEQSECSA